MKLPKEGPKTYNTKMNAVTEKIIGRAVSKITSGAGTILRVHHTLPTLPDVCKTTLKRMIIIYEAEALFLFVCEKDSIIILL